MACVQAADEDKIPASPSCLCLRPHTKDVVHLEQTYKPSLRVNYLHVLLQVPANRIGSAQMSLAQLKILQEVITLSVFVPFAVFYMNQPLKLDYLWAALCLAGAVYFIFRG